MYFLISLIVSFYDTTAITWLRFEMDPEINDCDVTRLCDHGHFCRNFDDAKFQQVWKSYYRDLFNINKEEVFSAFRITASKLGLCTESDIGQVMNQNGKMNHVDVETGKLFISPTSKNRVYLLDAARRSVERMTAVRVSVITSSDAGTVQGWDLGSYKVSLVDTHNFIVLVPNPSGNDDDSLTTCGHGGESANVGKKIIYDGKCFESEGEARFAYLLDHLQVPYHYERKEHMVPLRGGGQSYLVDFLLWPGERRSCYVEKKHHKPTLTEEEKVRSLVRRSGRTTYIVWGTDFCQPIRSCSSDGDTGLQAIRFWRKGSRVLRREGFYLLSAQNMSTGTVWKRMDEIWEEYEGPTSHSPFSQLPSFPQEKAIRRIISRKSKISPSLIHLTRKERQSVVPLPIGKKTCIRLKDGTVYCPEDTISLSFTSDPRSADCHSHDIMSALRAARVHVFNS